MGKFDKCQGLTERSLKLGVRFSIVEFGLTVMDHSLILIDVYVFS